MHLGLPAINTSDEIRSFGTPATRVVIPTDGSNWGTPGLVFIEVTAVGMTRTRSEQTIATKLILKLGGKIKILGTKIFLLVSHLWTRLLFVQTQPTEQCHQLNPFLSGKNGRPHATDITNVFSNTTSGIVSTTNRFIKALKTAHVPVGPESNP